MNTNYNNSTFDDFIKEIFIDKNSTPIEYKYVKELSKKENSKKHTKKHTHPKKRSTGNCCGDINKVTLEKCEDVKSLNIDDLSLEHTGRLLLVRVKLFNICKTQELNLGVIICEKIDDNLVVRFFKIRKLLVKKCENNEFDAGEFCFVFPDDYICESRKFYIKVVVTKPSLFHKNCPFTKC